VTLCTYQGYSVPADLDYLKSKADELTRKSERLSNTTDNHGRNGDEDAGISSREKDSNLMDINSQGKFPNKFQK